MWNTGLLMAVHLLNLRQGGREKTHNGNEATTRHTGYRLHSIRAPVFTRAKQKARYRVPSLDALFSSNAFRFFSADIDGGDPMCYDMGSERENKSISSDIHSQKMWERQFLFNSSDITAGEFNSNGWFEFLCEGIQ